MSKRILVMEDEKDNRQIIRDMLAGIDCEITEAKDAEQALAAIAKERLHFEKDQTPPAEGFWSIKMYDAQYFFVANHINRYSISPRQNLKASSDGSIDIYVQKDTPGADKEANWLPAPAGKFILMLRMYWPN